MRTLKFFAFVAILAVALTSCKKEEEFTIVGKWNIDKTTTTLFINGMQIGTPEESINDGWILFNSNNTGTMDNGESFTWSLSGDNLTITMINPGEYDLESITFNLTTKEVKRVVAESTFTLEEDFEGQPITLTVKIVLELSKL